MAHDGGAQARGLRPPRARLPDDDVVVGRSRSCASAAALNQSTPSCESLGYAPGSDTPPPGDQRASHISPLASVCCGFEFAGRLIPLANLVVDLAPITRNVLGAPARRPRNSLLVGRRLGALGLVPLRPWPDALQASLATEGHLAALPPS